LKPSIPVLLSLVVAAVGVVGVVVVAAATDVGVAPGNGEKVFDAPGCLPKSYAGPGRRGHYQLNRNCPRPRPVIVRRVSRAGGEWLVTWDGSRSFDPMGGKLVEFEWRLDDGHVRSGRKIVIRYRHPGPHSVVLYVTNDSGLYGTEKQTVRLR
jgi:hypothetical protein